MAAIGTTNGALAGNNLGRHKLDWDQALWEKLDRHVCAETERSRLSTRFLPVVSSSLAASTRTVPADAVVIDEDSGAMSVPEGAELSLEERSVTFVLTKQQYESEECIGTAVTLATRAANHLAREMDKAVFQGGGDGGLLGAADHVKQIVEVPSANSKVPGRYGERYFGAVAEAYALLESNGHYGPYALVSHFEPFADAHAPLSNTLIMPADRIRALVQGGFHGTGTLPPKVALLVSTGGNTLDVAIAVDAVTAFAFEDASGLLNFRVYERFTLRVKDPSAVVQLRFA
ncbi:bacteriocin family protein [Streptomyces sp. YC504]|uniref:Type 1 encapsulin shell protein n=1 Tax=Streptomyces mesophilus TaxID=1775132 RepID=A0A6G4XI11_9ACTN|nr:family 1 encapsulin nanocompartment shell protein [Streptomyces mesophilus]NGO76344.1 bacteriocin family protein [Streptomyces mesophilus]